MNLKIKLNGTDIPNNMILDKLEFSEDIGVNDFTVGKFILPVMKTKIHNDIEVKHGDVFTVYLDDEKYHTYEPYEIKKGNMSREITAYGMPYFALTQTYQPSTTNYTTSSLLLELQTALNIVVVGFQDIVAVDMPNVKPDTAINLLQAVAMLLQSNVRINPHGEIEFIKVDTTTTHEIVQSQITSISKSDTTDYHITQITGRLSEDDENPIMVGTSANAWNNLTLINPYLTQTVCTNILSSLPQYSGFDIKIFNAPVIKPLDKIKFTYQGVEYIIPVMDITTSFSTGGLVARIKANVSNANDKVSNYKGSLTTRLEVVKNITSELDTKITVIDGNIGTLINKTDVIEGDITTINEQYSQINQTIGEIDLRVGEVQTEISDKVSTDEIISSINLSTEGVKIKGDKIQLTGGTIVVSADGSSMSLDEYLKAEEDSENFILTPNFNSGSLSPNWTWSVGAFVYIDTTYKHGESTACRLKGSASAISLNTNNISISKLEKKTYKLSMWIYCTATSSTTGEFQLCMYGKTSGATNNTLIDSLSFNGNNLNANQWTQLSFEFTPTQEYSTPSITVKGVSGSIDAWVTDFLLVQKGEAFTQEQLINIINGVGDGFYILDGQAYINAEYIKSGELAADLIRVRVDGTTNLLPFNYTTMDNAMNTDAFSISTRGEVPHMEVDIPIYRGGGSADVLCAPIGYSHVKLREGMSYWFSCEVMAHWDNDSKLEDGKGTSTVGGGSKTGIGTQTGNNLDLFLYNGTDKTKINYGRNLLDGTAGNKPPRMFSASTYAQSGVALSVSTTDGGTTMRCISTTEENYLRFMPAVPNQMYGLEAGCTYTLSGYTWGTMSEIYIRHQYHVDGGEWTGSDTDTHPVPVYGDGKTKKYFEYTFTIPSDAVGFYLSFQDYARVLNKWVCISKLKLEKSSIATPWCLSPADQGISLENPYDIEYSCVAPMLASMRDFNDSIDIEERYEGSYVRTWTRLVCRVEATYDYEGSLWINLDGSGFGVGSYAYFYIQNLQLVDASQNDETIQLDYVKQLKEKRIELTDGSYFTNLVGVDGIKLTEGIISGETKVGNRYFKINYDGYKFASPTGSEHSFLGLGKSYYRHSAGSTGWIDGYDAMYGVGCTKIIGGDNQGIFLGVHEGFQVPNGQEYGRADIYRYSSYNDTTALDDWSDWELLGARVEPNGLVRRNDRCAISTSGMVITGDGSDGRFPNGEQWHGSVIFSEPMHGKTGNGQIVNTNTDSSTIYLGNPRTPLKLETYQYIEVVTGADNGVQRIITNGLQLGHPQVNIYTGSNIEILADSDCSSTTEYVSLGAGRNAITITSNGQDTSNSALKYNSQEIIHGGNREATGMIYGTCLSGCTSVGNLNNIWRSGFYDGFNLSNAPEGNTGWFWVINASHMSNNTGYKYGLQIAGLNVQGNAVWMRCTNDQGVGTWYRYYNTGWQQTSTSDIRYKRAIADVNTSDCYDMVKNTQLHHYLLLDDTDELRACSEDGIEELETELDSEGYSRKVQMGIIAQDVLKYECGKYFVVQDINKDDDGNVTSDKYSIDAYNYASAILGGLQEEIRIRDNQYEELKQENEELKQRLARIEAMLNQ